MFLSRFSPDRRAMALEIIRDPEHAEILAEAHGDEDFAAWLLAVDVNLLLRVGFTRHSMLDFRWREAFDAGDSPRQVAEEVIAAEFGATL